jgi:hypothetical protein
VCHGCLREKQGIGEILSEEHEMDIPKVSYLHGCLGIFYAGLREIKDE